MKKTKKQLGTPAAPKKQRGLLITIEKLRDLSQVTGGDSCFPDSGGRSKHCCGASD